MFDEVSYKGKVKAYKTLIGMKEKGCACVKLANSLKLMVAE